MKTLSRFPLFQSHLDLAHSYWKRSLQSGDIAIDATCGNGHDTEALAEMILNQTVQGKLIAIDKQTEAIEATLTRLRSRFSKEDMQHVTLLPQCHSSFPSSLPPQSIALIVYNLGYLPGGNKALTTMRTTTSQSLEAALSLIKPGGCISITCYPGHAEGKLEEDMLVEFTSHLSPSLWSCCHHRWINRRNAPSLLIIQKTSTDRS